MYEIADRITNDEDFDFSFQLLDDDNVAIPLAGYSFEVAFGDETGRSIEDWTAGVSVDLVTNTARIYKAVDDGISDLAPDIYKVGCRYNLGGLTRQLFVLTLTVAEGMFS